MTRTVLITGATGRLGRVMARYLAENGWSLVLTSRDAARSAPLARELRALGVGVATVELDLLSVHSRETLADRVADAGVTVTHFVSNARSLDTLKCGVNGLAGGQAFLDELTVGVVAPYRVLMAFAQHPAHDLRAIVSIGSQYGEVAPNPALHIDSPGGSPVQYGVGKAALHHLTRELAVRLAPRVRVNCVAFGGFEGRASMAVRDRYGTMAPAGRMLAEQDAGGPVAFLLDDAASAAVTGHVLVADGGWSIW